MLVFRAAKSFSVIIRLYLSPEACLFNIQIGWLIKVGNCREKAGPRPTLGAMFYMLQRRLSNRAALTRCPIGGEMEMDFYLLDIWGLGRHGLAIFLSPLCLCSIQYY